MAEIGLPVEYRPLRYLIGGDDSYQQKPDELVEYSYDMVRPCELHYGTLTSERERFRNLKQANSKGKYAPYLPADDVTNAYGEWMPSPRGTGFLQNVQDQIERVLALGCTRLELDNADYTNLDLAYVIKAHDLAWRNGLRTACKNPYNTSDPERYMEHESIDLVIVEHGEAGSDIMDELRRAIGQPRLAIRFVGFGDQETWCHNVAARIREKGYVNMGVTFSPDGEYTSFIDHQVPRK